MDAVDADRVRAVSTFDNNDFYEDGDLYEAELARAGRLSRDGILLCAACGERPASVTLALPELGIVTVCSRCAGNLILTTLAASADDTGGERSYD
jgi:hypothetical protein